MNGTGTGLPDPHDLAAFRGPDTKTVTDGGIGRPKKRKGVSAQFIDAKAEKRARKTLGACRICPNGEGWRVEPHHIVRRGAPHFGTWETANICALCLGCHAKLHAGDTATLKAIRLALTRAEVDWSDSFAYQGYVDAVYWPLPKDGAGQTVVASEVIEPALLPLPVSGCKGATTDEGFVSALDSVEMRGKAGS